MKLDKNKYQIALARACMTTGEVIKITGMPAPSVHGALYGKSVRPATLGKIARALGVDVTEIMETEDQE